MANLKDSFSEGITAINVKTNNFMEENKCKTYIATLENEIQGLKQMLGQVIYEHWVQGNELTQGIDEILEAIQQKYNEIEIQRKRIQQLQLEEKQILGVNAEQVGIIFCSQCGSKNAMNYKFCCKCGKPLR